MAKVNFKLRLPSIRICRPKKPSSLPKIPSKLPAAPAIFTPANPKMLKTTNPKLTAPAPSTPSHPFSKFKLIPLMSGCISKSGSVYVGSLSSTNKYQSPALSRLCNSPVSEDLEEITWPPVSFLSVDGGRSDQESEGLLSSGSSFDSSYDFGYSVKTINEAHTYGKKRSKKTRKSSRQLMKRYDSIGNDSEKTLTMATLPDNELPAPTSPARKSILGRLIPCMVEGKVNESYAVMKQSEDPYDDFKKSMMEMIQEKDLEESEDLEELLVCFLSLNAKDHHSVIVEAFTQVWQELFSSIYQPSSRLISSLS